MPEFTVPVPAEAFRVPDVIDKLVPRAIVPVAVPSCKTPAFVIVFPLTAIPEPAARLTMPAFVIVFPLTAMPEPAANDVNALVLNVPAEYDRPAPSVVDARTDPVEDTMPAAMDDTPVPPRATASVPDVILLAFVVSVVAEAAKPETAPEAMAMAVLDAAVSCPCALTVNVATDEAEP